MATEEAAHDIMHSRDRAARIGWSANHGWRAVALPIGFVGALSGVRSIKLYRGPARHRYHAVESIQRSRHGAINNQGASLRPVGNGCGTAVERHTPSRVRPPDAGIPGIAGGYGLLYRSGRNTARCRPSV